jgi:hypothetical protein
LVGAGAGGGDFRFAQGVVVGQLQRLRQGFGEFDFRGFGGAFGGGDDAVLVAGPECRAADQDGGDDADDAAAADPDEGERAAEAGRRRGIDEAAFAQRLDALVDDAVGDRETLACVDFAQARAQRFVALALAQFAFDEKLAMADRVDHVHREHQFVERLRLSGRDRCCTSGH